MEEKTHLLWSPLTPSLSGGPAFYGLIPPDEDIKRHWSARSECETGNPPYLTNVIWHATVSNFESTMETFTHGVPPRVSAHYVIAREDQTILLTHPPKAGESPKDRPPPALHTAPAGSIFQLVDPADGITFHAGFGRWRDFLSIQNEKGPPPADNINAKSIGIEVVSPLVEPSSTFVPYTELQTRSMIWLGRYINARYGLPQTAHRGHNDVDPDRKIDPGPAFPWDTLFNAGICAGLTMQEREETLDLTAQALQTPFKPALAVNTDLTDQDWQDPQLFSDFLFWHGMQIWGYVLDEVPGEPRLNPPNIPITRVFLRNPPPRALLAARAFLGRWGWSDSSENALFLKACYLPSHHADDPTPAPPSPDVQLSWIRRDHEALAHLVGLCKKYAKTDLLAKF